MSSQTEVAAEEPETIANPDDQLESIRKKLQAAKDSKAKNLKRPFKSIETKTKNPEIIDDEDGDLEEYYLGKDSQIEKQKKMLVMLHIFIQLIIFIFIIILGRQSKMKYKASKRITTKTNSKRKKKRRKSKRKNK